MPMPSYLHFQELAPEVGRLVELSKLKTVRAKEFGIPFGQGQASWCKLNIWTLRYFATKKKLVVWQECKDVYTGSSIHKPSLHSRSMSLRRRCCVEIWDLGTAWAIWFLTPRLTPIGLLMKWPLYLTQSILSEPRSTPLKVSYSYGPSYQGFDSWRIEGP